MRLAVVVSHPIQYYAPIFRALARRVDLQVFYSQTVSSAQQAAAGYDHPFDWDIDLLEGYPSVFLNNVAREPGPHHFRGSDTPDIGRRLRRGAFDGLLVFGWYLKSLVQTIYAAKRLGMPVIVRGDSHLNTPRGILKRCAKAVVYPPLLRVFDAALCVGQHSRAYFEHYGYPSQRLFASPHCVDTAWFAARATAQAGQALRSRLGIRPADRVVLFAGRLVPFKRPLDIIDACATDGACGVHVVVAGGGEMEAPMRARAASLGVSLHLLGFQNQTQMPAAYAAADVLVLPSTAQESWGLVANEALACGTPILVSDAVGCAPDLAAPGAAGRVFPVGDPIALGSALAEIISHPPSPEAIAATSRAHGVSVAVDGIEVALAFVTRKRTRKPTHA